VLKGLDPLLSPELLRALAAMGHGDEVVVVDGNFPAASLARRLVRLDGADGPRAVRAVLSVLPLDTFTPTPAAVMSVVGAPEVVPEPVREFRALLEAAAGHPVEVEVLERSAFYERARAAFVVVATGEPRAYGNLILTKGVLTAP
jgi:L-fucose mutarotase